MRRWAWAVCLIGAIGAAGACGAQEAAGNWLGAVGAGETRMRLAVHISRGPDGLYSGTLDSLDKGAVGLPLSDLATDGGHLGFTAASLHARYEGRWDENENAFVGTWSQGSVSPLTLTRGAAAPQLAVGGLGGDWAGTLAAGGQDRRFALHFRTSALGLVGSVNSPEQGINGLLVSDVSRQGANVGFSVGAMGATFFGEVSKDGRSMAGTWSQGGVSNPLTFTRKD